jgi:hypothetical protein
VTETTEQIEDTSALDPEVWAAVVPPAGELRRHGIVGLTASASPALTPW